MRSAGACLVVATLLLAQPMSPGRAFAQVDSREGIALQNQIYQLRQDLRALQDQIARGGGAPARAPAYAPAPAQSGDLVAQLLTRVDALEEQVRQLRGRIDETQNQVQRQGADLNKRIEDLAFQVSPQGGAKSSPPPAAVAPVPYRDSPSAPPPPPAAPMRRTPELALQEGNAALARRDYIAAEASAREVLANRTSPRAYDAQLLLAQSLSGQKQYAQAAIAYDDAYNRSRKGVHAQDALLGLANSLAAINEKKASCDTLVRLKGDFATLRPDIRDGAAAASQRAGCR
jgi:TolA-binding protein